MRARRRRLFAAMLGAALAAWAADPLLVAEQTPARVENDLVLGSWQLNVAKSTYSPGPAPKNQTRTYEAHPKGVRSTIRTTYADGRSTTIQYIANYDSIEYPVTGSLDYDTITLKKIDAYTAEVTLSHASKVFGTARRAISKDGKTMTMTFQGRDEKDRLIKNVAVYEKVS